MIEWTGRNTEGKVIGNMIAKDTHDLFTKLNTWVRDDSTDDFGKNWSYSLIEDFLSSEEPDSDSTPDYFDRDLIIEFLSKKEPKLAKLDKDINQQTELICKTVDMLNEEEVIALIEFAGEAEKNEFGEYYYELVLSSDGACWVKTYTEDSETEDSSDITYEDFKTLYQEITQRFIKK